MDLVAIEVGTLNLEAGHVTDRLARVKRAYDPDNLFRPSHNIPPAA